MGIKGIYGEIGPGERIALSKLAIEKLEETGRPLRIAIDVSIWQFQIQAGRGGSDPATRTLYYRLLRLLASSVQPFFVFDGPNRPPFKRNKRTVSGGGSVSSLLTKQLLDHFGFPYHYAPGEAEAECALLQREGVVDAVLSEDVDTLMFGSGLCLRNWSSEGTKGSKAPTHVSAYHATATKEGRSGLDREGMILVALMSGGDYITEGIPGCGIKLACEAARAGFGKSLCSIRRSDTAGYEAWRRNLEHEILSNESKFFRTKRKTLKIPEDFPNREVLSYYTHPVVSTATKIQMLKRNIKWEGRVDVQGLRRFVAEAFEWTQKDGAKKFIRGLAPALLVHKLRTREGRRDSEYRDLVLIAMNENELVQSICGKREHFSNDGIPELRLIYHPLDIVDVDLDTEEETSQDYGRDGLAPQNDEEQIEKYVSDDATKSASLTKLGPSMYDPAQPDKVWVARTIVRIGIPLKVEDYEESIRNPKKAPKKSTKTKAVGNKVVTRGTMQKGAIGNFFGVSKPDKQAQKALVPKPVESSKSPFISSIDKPRATEYSTDSITFSSEITQTKGRPKSNSKAKEKVDPTINQGSLSHTTSTKQPTAKIVKATPPQNLTAKARIVASPEPVFQTYSIRSSPVSTSSSAITSTSTPSVEHMYSPFPSLEDEMDTHVELPSSVRVTRGKQCSNSHLFPNSTASQPCTPSKASKNQQVNKSSGHKKFLLEPIRTSKSEQSYSGNLPDDLSMTRSRALLSLTPSPLPCSSDQESWSTSMMFSSTEALPRQQAGFSVRHSPQVHVLDQVPIRQLSQASTDLIDPKMPIIDLCHSPPALSLSPSSSPHPQPHARPSEPTAPRNEAVTETTSIQNSKIMKVIVLRDSLPGGWKIINAEDQDCVNEIKDGARKPPRASRDHATWRLSQIESVDLSGD